MTLKTAAESATSKTVRVGGILPPRTAGTSLDLIKVGSSQSPHQHQYGGIAHGTTASGTVNNMRYSTNAAKGNLHMMMQ